MVMKCSSPDPGFAVPNSTLSPDLNCWCKPPRTALWRFAASPNTMPSASPSHIAAHAQKTGVNLFDDVGPAEDEQFVTAFLAPEIIDAGIAHLSPRAHGAVVDDDPVAYGLEKRRHQRSAVSISQIPHSQPVIPQRGLFAGGGKEVFSQASVSVKKVPLRHKRRPTRDRRLPESIEL